jgi:hypothetical protein
LVYCIKKEYIGTNEYWKTRTQKGEKGQPPTIHTPARANENSQQERIDRIRRQIAQPHWYNKPRVGGKSPTIQRKQTKQHPPATMVKESVNTKKHEIRIHINHSIE